MSKFYGTVQGQRGRATRCGHFDITTHAASWAGAVRTRLSDRNGTIWATVETQSWHGHGERQLIYDGPLNATILPAGIRSEEPIWPPKNTR